jgi:TetR/AcrR family transcriptional repressor of nem operon
VRKRIEAAQEAYREQLLPFVPGQTREEKLAKLRLLLPSISGVLTTSRLASTAQKREQLLKEARNFFIKTFATD